ncbi:MAG: DUF2860 family protein [Campylobacteraceae bacterium]|nr:DUF2860 family protein [Campylobacteraceae bacterium]
MKKILLSSILAISLYAQNDNFFELGLGAKQSENNFSSDSSKIINTYAKAEQTKTGIPYFRYSYKNGVFLSKTDINDIFIGASFDKFEIGLLNNLENFLSSTWKNPFLLNRQREKTVIQNIGISLKYDFIKSVKNASSIQSKLYSTKVKNDEVIDSLKRDGKKLIIISKNRYLNFLYDFSFTNNDTKGKASSFKAYKTSLGFVFPIDEKLKIITILSYEKENYNEINTVLNQKIKNKHKVFFAMLKWDEPFALKNKYINFNFIKSKNNSNHDFYLTNDQLTTVSFGFKF